MAGAVRIPDAWRLRGDVVPAVRRGLLVASPVGLALLTDLGLDDAVAGGLGTAALIAGFIAFDAPARVRLRWHLACAPLIGLAGAIGVLSGSSTALAVVTMLVIAAVSGYCVSVSLRMAIAGLSCTLALLLAQGFDLNADQADTVFAIGLVGGLAQAVTAGLAWLFADRDREEFSFAESRRTTAAALRDGRDPSGASVRHAIRFGVTMAAGVLVYRLAGLDEHGYWIPLTILFVLKPDLSQTSERIAMRAAGTVIGLVLATFLAEVLGDALIPTTIVLTLAAAFSFALLAIEYALFTTSITLFAVLLTDSLGEPALHAAGQRGLGTAVGITLAGLAFWVYGDQARRERRKQPA